MVWREDRVCTSISFNFHTLYRVEIRFSDNPRQKDKIGDIIWSRRKKCVIYRFFLTAIWLPQGQLWSLSLAEHLVGFELGTFRFWPQCLNPLGHSPQFDIFFTITHVVQLMVSKSTCSARGIFVDIRRGI